MTKPSRRIGLVGMLLMIAVLGLIGAGFVWIWTEPSQEYTLETLSSGNSDWSVYRFLNTERTEITYKSDRFSLEGNLETKLSPDGKILVLFSDDRVIVLTATTSGIQQEVEKELTNWTLEQVDWWANRAVLLLNQPPGNQYRNSRLLIADANLQAEFQIPWNAKSMRISHYDGRDTILVAYLDGYYPGSQLTTKYGPAPAATFRFEWSLEALENRQTPALNRGGVEDP